MNTEHNNTRNHPVEQVDERRRRFLAKLLAGGTAVAMIPAMATVSLGDERDTNAGKRKKKRGKRKGNEGEKAVDPATLAARLIQEFDRDGDRALNVAELTEAVKSLRKSRKGKGNRRSGGSGRSKAKRA